MSTVLWLCIEKICHPPPKTGQEKAALGERNHARQSWAGRWGGDFLAKEEVRQVIHSCCKKDVEDQTSSRFLTGPLRTGPHYPQWQALAESLMVYTLKHWEHLLGKYWFQCERLARRGTKHQECRMKNRPGVARGAYSSMTEHGGWWRFVKEATGIQGRKHEPVWETRRTPRSQWSWCETWRVTAHTREADPGVRVYTGGGGSPRETHTVREAASVSLGVPNPHPDLLLEPRTLNRKYFKTCIFPISLSPLSLKPKI